MTVDLVDQAFLTRLRLPVAPRSVAAPPPPAIAAHDQPNALDDPDALDDPVLSALLAGCPEQWARLADRVEAAWSAGERVVAVAGRARGDGVSTVVRGLVRVVHERGRAVTIREPLGAGGGAEIFGRDDGGLLLVDGGVWFPPGPVHRGRLARAALGCHAAVLVRRAGRSPCPAHAAALAALGIRVLGEVVTFAESPTQSAPTRA